MNFVKDMKELIDGMKPKTDPVDFLSVGAKIAVNTAALQTGKAHQVIVNEAVNLWLEKHGLSLMKINNPASHLKKGKRR